MLRIDSKNTSYNGASILNDRIVAYFNGNNNGTNLHIDINIDDVNLVNFSLLKADLDDFVDEIAKFPIVIPSPVPAEEPEEDIM